MKQKNKHKIPAHMFGLFSAISQMGSQAGQVASASGAPDVGAMMSGAANPFMAGMEQLGNSDISTGNKLLAFTGLGSIFGARQARKAAKRREERKRTAEFAKNMTTQMTDEYWSNNVLPNAFAVGGFPNTNLAYLDNGELVRDAAGNISEIPSTMKERDGHLVNASNLESVLSDELFIPGTKQTFADAGKTVLGKFKPSKNVGPTADMTDMLNDRNIQNEYNNLLLQQEEYKMKNNIQPREKSIPGYAKGFSNSLLNAPSLRQTPKLPLAGQFELSAPSLYQPAKHDLSPIYDFAKNLTAPTTDMDKRFKQKGSGFNPESLIEVLGTTAPIAMNTINSLRDAEIVTGSPNVHANTINNIMARRRMNIDPMLDQMTQTRAINRYNIANLSSNTGMNKAYGTQSAVDMYKNIAQAYGNKTNVDNQYLGEYASILDSLGQQYEQNRRYADDITAQNKAMKRNYLNTAATQLGEWSQVRAQGRNQKRADDMMMPFLKNFLSQGYDSATMAELNKLYYGGRK